MEHSDNPIKPSILPFPAPQATNPHLANPEHLPHDVAALRRPVAVDRATRAPALRAGDGLAHDARNVLTSLELFTTLLAEPGVLAIEHRHLAEDLRLLGGTLRALIDRIGGDGDRASATTAEAQATPVVRREPVRPRAAVAVPQPELAPSPQVSGRPEAGTQVKGCERLLAAIAGPQVALHISVERGLGELAMNNDELTRVLINLVKNASEAMPGGGRCSIGVRRAISKQPAALITVQDTGCGIPPHALGQIFQAGFSSKRPGERWPSRGHHGLGLTIVRTLVEEAGGSVRVVSAVKKGTTFELKIPCKR
jgi:signal transduction histidine kinase